MTTIKMNYNILFRICAVAAIVWFGYTFSDITCYLFLAFIMMLLGRPVTRGLGKIRIGKKNLPQSVCAALTILIFLIVLLVSVFFFIPSLISELRVLQKIDYNSLVVNLNIFLNDVQSFLYQKNFLEPDQTLVGLIIAEVSRWIDFNSISATLGNIVSSTGSFFFGLFAVFFITFFFLKDDMRIENALQIFFDRKYVDRLTEVVQNINHLLSRYFIGIVIKTAIMTVLLYIGFALFGIKGAILMALIGGITNIIPYLGPFIGWGVVCVFGLTNAIGTGMYTDLLPMLIKVSITFISANVVDNLVLGPIIYSQSIKAHPVEVFLITILGGRIAGMAGMILGIPVYTIIRIALIEIYQYVTRKETEHFDVDTIGL